MSEKTTVTRNITTSLEVNLHVNLVILRSAFFEVSLFHNNTTKVYTCNMKTAILATLITGAAAFAPAQSGVRTTSLNSVPEADAKYVNDIGVTAPLGVWDPIGVLARGEDEVARYRALEIKHGRVAMLGVVGYLTTYAGVRFPGLEDVPCGWAAVTSGDLPFEVVGQFWATVIMMEMFNRDNAGTGQFPGDFRNGYIDFGWDKQSDEWKQRKRTLELNQGRAAQMGLIGLMFHDALGNVADILP